MFNELVESVSAKKKTNTTWGVIASLSIQCAFLLALILIPLIYTQALPSTIFGSVLIAPAPPPPTPPQTIRKVLAATGGNKSRAAQILGIERKTLYRKLERMK